MSVHYLSAAWNVTLKNPGRKLVLIALADMANFETGACFPSVRKLSKFCCIRAEAVRDHLAALEKEGLIIRHPRFIGGRQTSNIYQFCGIEAARFVIGKAPPAMIAEIDMGEHHPPNG